MSSRTHLATALALGLVLGCSGDDTAASDSGTAVPTDSARDSSARDSGEVVDGARPDVGSPRDGGRVSADSGAPGDAAIDATTDASPLTAARCFADAYASAPPIAPNYEAAMATIGSHCFGTNHQSITGVERVVFLGDSVTAGTQPTLSAQFYRSIVADGLATRFGLTPPSAVWKTTNPLTGTSSVRESGAFASCAEWGGDTNDLLSPGTQIGECFPESRRGLRTLVIMTVGGNDVADITRHGVEGVPIPDIWDEVRTFVQQLEDAIRWLKEPGRFPAGVDVVFGNMYEFTDGTGVVTDCDAARLAGFSSDWDDPSILADMVVYAEEQYMRIAVETGSDMIFLFEEFCGHGFNHGDSTAPCYRGPGTPLWFDVSCTHPNPAGHQAIADMFLAVVDE